ncbi:MAG: hypothetical protein Ct9H90mP22_4530 [Gammaproteobacteria bacterium]|nr:MAG: hypothetical protein Ct9H90mP22_4530 [Gammaproteobacteria bacterium]
MIMLFPNLKNRKDSLWGAKEIFPYALSLIKNYKWKEQIKRGGEKQRLTFKYEYINFLNFGYLTGVPPF